MDIPSKMENNFNKSILGLNIKYLRKQKKLTQSDLCIILEAKTTTLSNWEVGFSAPDLDILVKISNYFGVNLTDLILIPYSDWRVTSNENNSKECNICKEKDRTISALEGSISLLKEKVDDLKDKIANSERSQSSKREHYQKSA